MNGRIDGCLYGQMDRGTERLEGRKDGWIDLQLNERMDGLINE